MSRPEARGRRRKPQRQPERAGSRRVRARLKRSLIILAIVLAAASIGATIWLAGSGSPRRCQVGPGQLRVNVQPTRLLELPDYALETKITIINSSPCEMHIAVVKTKVLNATLTDGTVYDMAAEDSQSISLAIKPGGQAEVTYLFAPAGLDRKPTSLSVEITLGFEDQADILVFEGQIMVP